MRGRILAGCGAVLGLLVAAPAASAKPAPAPITRNVPITAAGLVGRWGDNGDCTKYIVFRSDGAFLSYTGGEGRWTLSGNRLVMTGSNGSFTLRVERVDRARIRITNPDGTIGISQRCPYSSR